MMDRKAVPFAAASLRGGAVRHPVTLDVPVRIRAEAHQAHPAFIEDTRTALVFSRGAVVPVGEPLDIGQSVLLTHRRTRQEIPCRVVYSKNQAGPGVKGYVELEFLRPAPNFWEIQFPYDEAMEAAAAMRSGAAVVNVPAPRGNTASLTSAPAHDLPVSDGPADVVALADAVMPSLRRTRAYSNDVVVSTPLAAPVTGHKPLVEDIETLLDRKAAASAAAEPAEAFTFNLPLDDREVFTAAPPRRGFSFAKLAAVAAGIAIVSLGAWQIVSGNSDTEAQISLAEAPALRAPVAPEIAAGSQPAAPAQSAPAVTENAAAATSTSAESSVRAAAAAAEPPRVIEQGHSAPVPFARVRAEEAARAAGELAMKSESYVEPRSLVNTMAPSLPSKRRVESAPPDAGVAPSMPASFSAEPIANLATTSSPAPIQGGRAVPPKLVSTARLMYPVLAKKSNIQGDVVIDAQVDAKGAVRDMKVTSGHAMLHQAALESVAQWRYQPGMLNGQPVEVRTTIVVKFRLGGQ